MEDTIDYPIEALKARITDLAINPDYRIKTADEASAVAAQMKSIHQLAKDVEAAKQAELEPLKVLVDQVREKWKPIETMAVQLKTTANQCLGDWQVREQRRIAMERAEAEAKAAKERAAAEAAARKAREDAERKAAEQAAKGNAEKAEAILHAAEQKAMATEVAASLIAPAPVAEQKLDGVRVVETWEPAVVDLRRALTSLLADEFCDISAIVDVKKAGLNKLAATYKDKLPAKYPGLGVAKIVKTSATGK